MKKKIGDIEYNIGAVPPYDSGLFKKIADLIQSLVKNPHQSPEEEKQKREEAKTLMIEIFKETVEPEPRKEDYLQLWNLVVNITNQAIEDAKLIEDAKFFRKSKRPNTKESGTVSHSSAQTPK